MSVLPGLDPALGDVLDAFGLLRADGSLDPAWFGAPMQRVTQALASAPRRAALESLVERLRPADASPTSPGGETWHRLLAFAGGALYFTVAAGDTSVWGVAAAWQGGSAALPDVSARVTVPLVMLGDTGAHPAADRPVELALRVAIPGGALGGVPLAAVRLSMAITFAGTARFSATLQGLDTADGRGPRDIALDSSSLSGEAVDVLGALLRAAVADPSAPPGPARAAIAEHLLPLLGMDGDGGMPPLPFAELSAGPAALRTWLRALGTQGLLPAWLGHLAGLFTGQATAVAGTGTGADPWRVPVLAIDGDASAVSVTLALDGDALAAGLRVALAPGGAAPAAALEAAATLLVVPLTGAASMQALPSYHVLLRAPATDQAWLAGDAGSAFAVRGLRCGVRGGGTELAPVLELVDVHIDGNVHPLVDLSSAHAVADEAKELLREALLTALGTSDTARHLLALLGLVPPASDPTRPYSLDLAAFAVDPLAALAALHRRVLGDAAHPWSHMLAELGALVGVTAPLDGTGAADDPWRLPLFTFGPATINLFGGPTAADRLQLGVMADVRFDAVTLSLRSEALLVDLPASAAPTVTVSGQRLVLRVAPLPPVQGLPGTRIAADAFEATLGFTPDQGLSGHAGLTNVTVTTGTQTFTLPLLAFPAPAVDPAHPEAAFGLQAAALDALFAAVLARAAVSWGGYTGFVVAALLGVHGGLAGVPAGWPTLRAAGAATVLDDPAAALQDVLRRLCDAPAGGRAFLTAALPWLGAILARTLPGRLVDAVSSGLAGTGTPADPWLLPVAGTGTSLTVALEPAGPPPAWASYLAPIIAAAASPKPLLQAARALAGFDPHTARALDCAQPARLVPSLAILADALASGDELVPLFDAVPFDAAWTRGRPLSAAHLDTPRDPEAIAQILERFGALGTAGARVALHVSPRFGDPASWDALLAAASAQGQSTDAAARFDLRSPGVDPLSAPLDTVTVTADHYVLALGPAPDRAGAVAQLARVVARVQQLRPGATLLLVGHSTAGLVVRAFAAANVGQVGAIVTVAAPLGGTPLLALRTPEYADAVRFLKAIGPVGTPGGALGAALANLNQALDGWESDAPALPPRPHDFPWDDFANSDGIATGGVPALALGSALTEPLAPALGQALSARLAQVLAGAAAPPTHLSIGLGASVPLPAPAAGQVRVRADVAATLFTLDLTAVRPRAVAGDAISARLRLERNGGWLVGDAGARPDPTAAAPETRLAAAVFDLRFTPADGLSVALDLRQAAHRGLSADSVGLTAPLADPVLGALATALDETANVAATALVDALVALGVGIRDDAGAFTFSADALAALRLTPGTFLAGRLRAALAAPAGWLGFTGGAAGPWTRPGTSLQLAANAAGGFAVTLGVVDSTAADGSVALADGAHLTAGVTSNGDGATSQAAFDVGVGAARLSWAFARGTLLFTADPYLPPLTLWPAPDAATRRQWIAGALPRLLFSGAASMAIEAVFGKGLRIAPLHALLESPARLLTHGHALGDGQSLQPAKVASLLADVGKALGLPIQGGVVALPGAFRLSVQAPPPAGSAGVLALLLETDAPLGGVATLALSADIDAKLEIALTAQLGLHLQLGSAPWATIDVTLEKTPAGLSLLVTPAGQTAVRLLPTFGGFGALAAGLTRFLPRVLDSLVTALSSGGQPALLQAALALADALGVHDAAGGFAAHADALGDLAAPGALGRVALGARPAVVAALARLFQDPGSPLAGALPGTFAITGGTLQWTAPSLAPSAGTMVLGLGFDDGGPRLELALDGLRVAGAAALTARVVHSGGQTSLRAAVDCDLLPALGVALQPRLALAAGGDAPAPFALTFLPLGAGSEGVLAIALAPAPSISLGVGAADAVAALAMMFGGRALLRTADAALDTPLYTGGPTTRALLLGAGLCTQTTTGQLVPAAAIPAARDALGGLLATLATSTTAALVLGPTATLSFDVADAGIGLRLQGSADEVAGPFRVRLLFGPPDAVLADADGGVHLGLFARGSDGHFTFAPRVRAVGLGVGLARPSGDPLFAARGFALGSAAGYLFFDLPLAAGETPAEPFGAALSLGAVALPLGLAQGGQGAGGNPVAASLLRGDGATSDGAGGAPSAAPAVDLLVGARGGQAIIRVQGGTTPFWLDVERTFGPLEIRRLGMQPFSVSGPGPGLAMLIDGGVKVDGLTVEVDGLSISFALRDVLNPTTWQLDLSGLALSFTKGGFAIAGGLRKDPGPPIEYDGVLLIEGAGRTISAVGAYGRPQDAGGSYTSLFAFVAIPATLGGPPFFFVTGLALGAGYNRALIIPAAVDDVASHPLLQAMDAGAISADPMAALRSMRALIPSRRGGFWVAAGVRFTSFGLVQSRALVYLALDGGLQIGVLGISRMLLPSSDDALVSVELALKARFSAAELILSVQAQLTDHSWLFSRDCQLTGGFALYAHFGGGAYVLTLGGYNPHFARPAEFPVVPRLGFRWRPSENATASGTAYFALTTSCVMAGGSLSIDYQRGGLHAWFTADANFLVAWHPFAYDVDISIEVGASYTFEVCFIKCWNTTLSVSLGVGLRLMGPPIRGEVTLDLDVTSITLSFGPDVAQPPYLPTFQAFADSFLYADDPAKEAVRALLVAGLERKDASAPVPAGTAADPWLVAPEVVFSVESRMPARRYQVQGGALTPAAGADVLDLAPMGDVHVAQSDLVVLLQRAVGAAWVTLALDPALMTVAPVLGPVPEATWHFRAPKELAAAANNLTALTALRVQAAAIGQGPSAVVPIATLATDQPAAARPLPLHRASTGDVTAWQAAGAAAEALATLGASGQGSALGVADAILATAAPFASARADAGLPRAGLPPRARRALARQRTAPPAMAPLAMGMTMRPVGLPPPPPRTPAVDAAPVALAAPRLRALLRPAVLAPAVATPGRTTVKAPGVVRTTPPSAPKLAGAELRRIAPAAVPPQTRPAAAGLVMTGAESGAGTGAVPAALFAAKEKAATDGGTTLGAGAVELWDLPAGIAALAVQGTGGLRITSLSRGGAVLADVDVAAPAVWTAQPLPDGTARVALSALGDPGWAAGAKPAVARRALASAAGVPVAGWTAAWPAVRVGARVVLVPGGHIVLPADTARPASSSEVVASAAGALAGTRGQETRLPVGTSVVAVLLDELDATARAAGDLSVAITGAPVASAQVLAQGTRRALIYELGARTDGATAVSVVLGSRSGVRTVAVLGLAGTAASAITWLQRQNLEVTLAAPPASASTVAVRFVPVAAPGLRMEES